MMSELQSILQYVPVAGLAVCVVLVRSVRRLQADVKALPCHPKVDGSIVNDAEQTVCDVMSKLLPQSAPK
jgi:hypothetical protein